MEVSTSIRRRQLRWLWATRERHRSSPAHHAQPLAMLMPPKLSDTRHRVTTLNQNGALAEHLKHD